MTIDYSKTACAECGKEYKRRCDLSYHISHAHGMSFEQYCLKHVCIGMEPGKCLVCGQPTKFDAGTLTYRSYCSHYCERHSVDRGKKVSEKMRNQDWSRIVKQRNATNMERYGTICTLHADGIKDKKLDSIRARFTKETGITDSSILETITNVAQLPSVRRTVDDKLRTFTQEKWDARNSKSRQTKLKRYGDATYTNREKAFKGSMSKPEKRMYEFLTNRGFDFKRNVRINGKLFDFGIYKDGELQIIIEIDGIYFHGLTEDPNGKHVHGETDCTRFTKVPDKVKYIVCDDVNIEQCFAEVLKVYDTDYNEWIQSIVDSMPAEFPYPSYSDARMQKDWKHLRQYYYVKHSQIGMSIINNFHKSIWDAHVDGKLAPSVCWHDKTMLEKVVKNRVIYKSNLSSQQIAYGFNVSKIAPKVSVFNPHLGKYLIETYLPSAKTIFDPFSGFSGRMLATVASDRQYVGQDISQIHVDESNSIIEYLGIQTAKVTCKDIFESTGEYDALFTCSPYGRKEQWGTDLTNLSCDQWIDECLARFKCKQYLFVVDHTSKYSDNVVYEIRHNSHLSASTEQVILITRKQ